MEFSKLLTEEHQTIRRALDVLKAMTEQIGEGAWPDRHDVNALLIFLHYFADVCHQAKEESILFPALKLSDDHACYAELENLLKDHKEDRSLIEETQRSLFTDKDTEFITSAQNLIDLFSDHTTKEEHILFPLAEQILTPQKGIEIAMRIQEADAQFGYAQRNLVLDMLQHLEEKYVRKAA